MTGYENTRNDDGARTEPALVKREPVYLLRTSSQSDSVDAITETLMALIKQHAEERRKTYQSQ
jgi:hypothetical protein